MTDEQKTHPIITAMTFDKSIFEEGGKFPTPTAIHLREHVRVLRVFEENDEVVVWVTTPSKAAVERFERSKQYKEEEYPKKLAEWEEAQGTPDGRKMLKPREPHAPQPIRAPLIVVRLGEEAEVLDAEHIAIVGVVDDLIFMAPVGREPSLFGNIFGGLF